MNIAIDGPAGAGKSTIAKKTAEALGSIYVDTGAMYRAMAMHMINEKVDISDQAAVERACVSADITIRHIDGAQHVFLNGGDVTPGLRAEEVGNAASTVSKYGAVRERLVELQRALAAEEDVVMDGRDIGTVVLPDADLKIFLTARPYVRALRRAKELCGGEVPPEEMVSGIEEEIRKRDEQDMTREISPLVRADDAVPVDSSDLSIEEVTEKILSLAAERRGD